MTWGSGRPGYTYKLGRNEPGGGHLTGVRVGEIDAIPGVVRQTSSSREDCE